MAFGNITSANSTAILTVDELFPAGIQIEGYSTDTAWALDEITTGEARIGIDGRMSAGKTFTTKSLTLTLEPTSPSISALYTLYSAQENNIRLYNLGLVISLPSIGQRYVYTDGAMLTFQGMPSLSQLLDPITVGFEFGKLVIESA